MADINKLYDLAEVEKILGVSRKTLLRYIESGTLKAVKLGGKWKVTEAELKNITEQ